VLEQIHLPRTCVRRLQRISVQGDRIAVVSQESSALWVAARPQAGGWWRRSGHPFRRTARTLALWDVEASWITSDVAVVRTGKGSSAPLPDDGESVHVFAFPPA